MTGYSDKQVNFAILPVFCNFHTKQTNNQKTDLKEINISWYVCACAFVIKSQNVRKKKLQFNIL